MGLFSFYYVFFIVKCHYGNNLYGSKNQEKTDQIHTGELGSQKDPRLQGTCHGLDCDKKTRLHASEDADAETVYCKWDEGAHNGYRK